MSRDIKIHEIYLDIFNIHRALVDLEVRNAKNEIHHKTMLSQHELEVICNTDKCLTQALDILEPNIHYKLISRTGLGSLYEAQ